MTVSDPNRPGTPRATEGDTTMAGPPQEFYGDGGFYGDAGQEWGAHRADRVREWVSRRSDERTQPLSGAPMPSPGQPVMPPSANRTQELSAAEGTSMGESSAEEGATWQRSASPSGAGGFASRLEERAKTVSAGMGGVAASAMGGNEPPFGSGTGQAASAVPAPNEKTTAIRRTNAARRTRKARLRISHVDPWSIMKTAFLFSVAAGIVLWVATGTVWAVIASSGMFGEINRMVGDIIQTPGDDTPFRIQDYISTNKVMGTAALIAVIDVVIFTALATLGAFLYNLASAMIGGLEVTLAED